MSTARVFKGPPLTSQMHRLETAVNQAVFDRMKQEDFHDIRPSHIAFVDQMGSGCRMTELAKRLGLTPGAVTQIADQMEKLKLVKRATDPSDRRAIVVRPTPKVREAWDLARRTVDAVEARWARRLGSRRFAELTTMLIELAAAEGTSARQLTPEGRPVGSR